MRAKRSNTGLIVILIIAGLALLGVGSMAYMHFNSEIDSIKQGNAEADAVFGAYSPRPFINSAADATPYVPYDPRDDAFYYYDAPEGFTIISHSQVWDTEMLELLYLELLKNEHGEELGILYEITVYPDEETQEDGNLLASYAPDIKEINFFIQFPAFPEDFTVRFPRNIGRINIYGGDTKTTVESIANSLSHEYGHLYTFYHMFNLEMREDDSLSNTTYAKMRDASKFDLITRVTPGDDYFRERSRYLIEIAAEDYVQLMGSPTSRQVVDFVDVRQMMNGEESHAGMSGARNAFPQENMMLPLANDVPGLEAYFREYIGAAPRVPIEEKQDITLQINQQVVHHDLVSGPRTFIYYTITLYTPYQEAIYTLASYDPQNYRGWGDPIKTVRSGQDASAVIGEYVITQGNEVRSIDDGRAEGNKIFYVVALLPDGTLYISEKLEYNFS